MFSTCLFCHASLGANQSIEHFPIGRRLAFDAERGRLWAVCPGCARWNLTPHEERWEAIEECERAYRGTKQRVSTDNIALARLRDGTDLVRIGRPLLPEISAWRYGDQLGRRRKRHRLVHVWGAGSLVALGATASVGVMTAALFNTAMLYYALPVMWGGMAAQLAAARMTMRPATHLRVPDGRLVELHQRDTRESRVSFGEDGALQLHLRASLTSDSRFKSLSAHARRTLFVLSGDDARRALGYAITAVNHSGAKPAQVQSAVREIESGNDVSGMLHRIAGHAYLNSEYYRGMFLRQPPETLLALEMLLHEEDERRAMAGELGELYARWAEAERIARIADGELSALPTTEQR